MYGIIPSERKRIKCCDLMTSSVDPDQATLQQSDLILHCLLRPVCLNMYGQYCINFVLTLNSPIPTKVACFSRLLKCLRSLYGKQCGIRSDCSFRSSLIWVHTVCFYTQFVSNVRQLFAADDFSRPHFQMHFFLGALRVNNLLTYL